MTAAAPAAAPRFAGPAAGDGWSIETRVTHESEIAAHARRQIRILDGLVDRDTASEGQ